MPEVSVSTTDPPAQKVVAPPGDDTATGTGFTVTEIAVAVSEQPKPFKIITV